MQGAGLEEEHGLTEGTVWDTKTREKRDLNKGTRLRPRVLDKKNMHVGATLFMVPFRGNVLVTKRGGRIVPGLWPWLNLQRRSARSRGHGKVGGLCVPKDT